MKDANYNLDIDGNLTVKGTMFAQEYHNVYTSSTTIYTSGSSKLFGSSPRLVK